MNQYDKTIRRVAELQQDGYSRAESIYMAFCEARADYFKKYPSGALPEWLAYPKGRRLSQHYMPNGAPARERLERNPKRKPQGRAGDAARAKRLYEGFTEEPADVVETITLPEFKTGLAPGIILGIIYETRIRGRVKRYIHEFKDSSRPLLAVSSDGKQFRSVGGRFQFTNRGFIDK